MGFRQSDDVAQRTKISVHAEDGFGGDKDAGGRGFRSGGDEQALQLAKVVVRENTESRARESGCIDEAGVG